MAWKPANHIMEMDCLPTLMQMCLRGGWEIENSLKFPYQISKDMAIIIMLLVRVT